jgi:hypothetical protein
MKKFLTVNTMAAVAAIAALFFSNSFATVATIQNAGFETYIAASDSFALEGGQRFDQRRAVRYLAGNDLSCHRHRRT